MNNYKLFYRLVGLLVFIITLLNLFTTVQPSLSFWDCGELAAASYGLQVSHPPGAPFFMLVNKIFSLIPFASDIGFRINSMTVVFSSFSILFLYVVCVKLIENYKGNKYNNVFDAAFTFIPSAIAALGFSFADTFWFNAVESNVFGFSTFLFSLIIFLLMLWNEKSGEPGSIKYLLMIAFVIGLSPGVHLMSVPALMPVVMLVVMKKYIDDEEKYLQSSYYFLGHMALILLIGIFLWSSQTGHQPPSPTDIASFDKKFKIFVIIASLVYVGIFYKKLIIKNSFYIPVVFGGIALTFTFPGLIKYLPMFLSSVSGDNITTAIVILLIILGVLGYLIYWSYVNKKAALNLVFSSVVLAIIGFSTYATIMIRASQNPPMNENDPHTFSDLVYYLSREQYGEMPMFKRRYSQEPQHTTTYNNYDSDLDFFWKYQMNHMFNRYLGWNFLGKESFEQDSGVNPVKFFGVPLILALLGLMFHFRKDWKMASIWLAMFIIMGYLIAYYQVQQEPQPRERIYFYGGAFFTFAVWISIGLRELIDMIFNSAKSKTVAQASAVLLLIFSIIFVPGIMYSKNKFTHDRSKNWLPWDYAYNILQSCPQNAILFTCGDNDTFPLWYLQDVDSVRTDVRIANLSLINTNWYPKQLKNTTHYGNEKVAMSFTDAQLDKLMPKEWNPTVISLPVPLEVFQQFGVKDTALLSAGKISFTMPAGMTYGKTGYTRNQDMLVRDIIENNKWKRPICFAITCGSDSKIGLSDYLRLEGMVERLVPFKKKENAYKLVEPELTKQQLFNENPSQDRKYKPGFKYRGLKDPGIFYDDNMERSIAGYRKAFITLATYYLDTEKDTINCNVALNKMDEFISKEVVKVDVMNAYLLMNLYYTLNNNKYIEYAQDIEKYLMGMLAKNQNTRGVSSELQRIRDIIQGKQKPDKTFDE